MPQPGGQPSEISTALAGLYVEEAMGRADALLATLTMQASPDDGDIAWAMMAAHSLKGLAAQVGQTATAGRMHELEDRLEGLAALPREGRAGGAAHIVAAVREVRGELEALGRAAGAERELPLERLAEAATAEIDRLARRRGIVLTTEMDVPAGIRVPRRLAGVAVDALGHVLRNAVAHGASRGGAIRVSFRREPETLSIVVGDRGNAASRDAAGTADLDSGRGVGVDAARMRLAAVGGELTVSPAPWGGTSVVIHLPMDDAARRRRG